MRYLKDNEGVIVEVKEDDDYLFTTLIAETYEDEDGLDKPKYAQVGRDNPAVTLAAPTVGSLSLSSGTAEQDTTGKPSIVFVQITGASSGTVKVETSVDGSTYHTLITDTAANAVASQVIPVPLAPLGYLKVTVSSASIAAAVQATFN